MVDISPVELERLCGIILGEVVKQDGQQKLFDEQMDRINGEAT
jgi:hypothetical protein